MHFSHDKHQYFFEKYLRKEMSGEELELFEKRLFENKQFRTDLDFYIKNRKAIVAEELAEYDKSELLPPKPQKWGWVYAVISLFCIVLIVDYFLTSRYSPGGKSSRKEPLIERINSFIRHPEIPGIRSTSGNTDTTKQKVLADSGVVQEPEDSVSENQQQLDQQVLPVVMGNGVAIQGDYFVTDSLFRVLDQSQVNERKVQMRASGDSTVTDSVLTLLAVKSFFRSTQDLPRQLLVEYWTSPIHLHGYLFNGKKLILYDVGPGEQVFLSCLQNNTNYHLYLNGFEYHLFADSQLHKLSEE